MTLNCWPGCIARTVDPLEQEDLFVTCLEFVGTPNFGRGQVTDAPNCWRVDRMMHWERDETGEQFDAPYVPDAYLRPIRDTGARDEVLTLVGLPEGIPA